MLPHNKCSAVALQSAVTAFESPASPRCNSTPHLRALLVVRMRFIAVQMGLVLWMLAFAAVASSQPVLQADSQSFIRWALQHNKPYLQDAQELAHRYTVWAANVAAINSRAASNAARGSSHQLGLTPHTDLARQEFATRYLGSPMTPQARTQHHTAAPHHHQQQQQVAGASGSGRLARYLEPLWSHTLQWQEQQEQQQRWRFENVTAPAAADWRTASPPVLGAIKDQHVNGTPCGSCWAFSAVSIMEIASAMSTGEVVLGSEQQLIDCDRKYDHGCSGGGWLNAIQYTINNKGLAREEQYPYTGKDGQCRKGLEKQRHQLQVHSWEDVPYSNESALAQAVSETPVIVAICVGPALDDWHHYTGGIFDAPCCEQDSEVTLDHGIVVVGYGTQDGTPYWILKNSWGAQWGEQGFMRIRRNHGKHGKCALASYPAMVFRQPLPTEPRRAPQPEADVISTV